MKPKEYRYNMQFACFECRKSFKQPLSYHENYAAIRLSAQKSGKKPQVKVRARSPVHVCPQCGSALFAMGRAFRAPATNNLEQWRKAELLVRQGYMFWPNYRVFPKTLSEAKKFIDTSRRKSKGKVLADRILSKKR